MTLKEAAIDTINKSERDIVGEFVDAISAAPEANISMVVEVKVTRFIMDICTLHPELDVYELCASRNYNILADMLMEAV